MVLGQKMELLTNKSRKLHLEMGLVYEICNKLYADAAK